MRIINSPSPRGLRVSKLLAAVLAVAALAPAGASANYTGWYDSYIGSGAANRKGDISRTTLTSSGVSSFCGSCRIWAGAHYAGGLTLYASWAEGYGDACHNYGTNNIGAMIEAPYVAQNIFLAIAGWQGNDGGFYC